MNRLGSTLTDAVTQEYGSREPVAVGDEYCSCAKAVGAVEQRLGALDAVLRQVCGVACAYCDAVEHALGAAAGKDPGVCHGRNTEATLFGFLGNHAGEGMIGGAFGGGSECQ